MLLCKVLCYLSVNLFDLLLYVMQMDLANHNPVDIPIHRRVFYNAETARQRHCLLRKPREQIENVEQTIHVTKYYLHKILYRN